MGPFRLGHEPGRPAPASVKGPALVAKELVLSANIRQGATVTRERERRAVAQIVNGSRTSSFVPVSPVINTVPSLRVAAKSANRLRTPGLSDQRAERRVSRKRRIKPSARVFTVILLSRMNVHASHPRPRADPIDRLTLIGAAPHELATSRVRI